MFLLRRAVNSKLETKAISPQQFDAFSVHVQELHCFRCGRKISISTEACIVNTKEKMKILETEKRKDFTQCIHYTYVSADVKNDCDLLNLFLKSSSSVPFLSLLIKR